MSTLNPDALARFFEALHIKSDQQACNSTLNISRDAWESAAVRSLRFKEDREAVRQAIRDRLHLMPDAVRNNRIPQEDLVSKVYEFIRDSKNKWDSTSKQQLQQAQEIPRELAGPSVVPNVDIQVIRADDPERPFAFRLSDLLADANHPRSRSSRG